MFRVQRWSTLSTMSTLMLIQQADTAGLRLRKPPGQHGQLTGRLPPSPSLVKPSSPTSDRSLHTAVYGEKRLHFRPMHKAHTRRMNDPPSMRPAQAMCFAQDLEPKWFLVCSRHMGCDFPMTVPCDLEAMRGLQAYSYDSTVIIHIAGSGRAEGQTGSV